MNQQVTDYIQQSSDHTQEIMAKVRQIMHKAIPGIVESFKWSRPVFGTSKDFAYLKVAKNHVTLGFYKFQKLEDKNNLLEGTGKDLRHLKLKTLADVDEKLLSEWFQILAK